MPYGTERALAPTVGHASRLRNLRFPLIFFGVVAVFCYVDARLAMKLFAFAPIPHNYPDHRLLDNFARYDSAWYYHIATKGYYYDGSGNQSPVAFFPAYPMAMRIVATIMPDAMLAGIAVTLACGAGATAALWRWAKAAFDEHSARFTVAAVLLYPFAFYLYGAVYSDALFLLAAIGAFVLLEDDRPVLAGLVGAVATATRPIGIALVVGLVLRDLEIRGVIGPARGPFFRPRTDSELRTPLFPRWFRPRLLRPADAGVLLSVGGLVGYCGYLWIRFGQPLAFEKVASSAPGWERHVDLHAIGHVVYFQLLRSYGLNEITFWLTMQGLISVASLVSVVIILRRLGRGYAAYVLIAVGLAFVSAPQFIGVGRYVIAAFPTFACVGRFLAVRRTRVRWARWARLAAFATSCGLLAWMTSLYARWVFLA